MRRLIHLAALLSLAWAADREVATASGAGAKLIRAVVIGGGTGHDFDRWYNQDDTSALKATGRFRVAYADTPAGVLPAFNDADVLVLACNQPLTDPAVRKGIFDFVNAGKGLVVLHPALSFNWPDWPEFYRVLAGGTSRNQDKLGPFEVTVLEEKHPVMTKVPSSFKVTDELQHFVPESTGASVEVLASGEAPSTGKLFPVVWVVKHQKARIVCISLGHDSSAHGNLAYKTMLQNSVVWASRKK